MRLRPPRPKPQEDPFSILIGNLDAPCHDDNLVDFLEAALKSEQDIGKIKIQNGQMNNALVQFEKQLSPDGEYTCCHQDSNILFAFLFNKSIICLISRIWFQACLHRVIRMRRVVD